MPQVLKEWDIDRIASLLRAAGEVALQYYEAPPTELKEDRTVVTAADKAVEKLLGGAFDAPAHDVWMIGEETVSSRSEDYIRSALQSDNCFVVDPIDGTAPYTAKLPVWGISIGFMKRGVLAEGAVYLPALDECLATCGGRLLQCKLNRENRWRDFTPTAVKLSPAGHIAIGQMPAHKFVFDCTNQLFAWSSVVGSVCWLLRGRVMAYLGDFKLWDVGGALPLLRAAGFGVTLLGAGKTLSLDLNDGGFILEPHSEKRWKVTAPALIARESAVADYILSHIHDTGSATS